MSEFYHPESARGFTWADPSVAIAWPFSDSIISDKDQSFNALD
jgi:dTDP-4-dehydrorhamnose 3,5-epimerase